METGIQLLFGRGRNTARKIETDFQKSKSDKEKAGLDNNSAFSVDDELAELNEKYGTIKKGANAERDIDVPITISDENTIWV